MTTRSPTAPDESLRQQFEPQLLTVLREGYGLPQLRADAVAGLTVAIVALPLSMAIAIASGWAGRATSSAGRRGPSSCWCSPRSPPTGRTG
jgi:hypothetical protein